jgi:hypothetical protein
MGDRDVFVCTTTHPHSTDVESLSSSHKDTKNMLKKKTPTFEGGGSE